MLVLPLALAAVLAADPSSPRPADATPQHPVPWFLPREGSIGVLVNAPAVSTFVRIGWEIGIYEQPRNDLIFIVNVGTGTALALPSTLRTLYQHIAVFGIGYRSTREVIHWGFHLTAGAIWYRASYDPKSSFLFEDRVLSYSEARAQIGIKFADHFVAGVFGGYASPWVINTRYPANIYLGGPMFGLFADWR